MDDIRNIIRAHLLEVVATRHYNDRIYDRFQSIYTNFDQERPEVKQSILNNIEYLKSVDFPDDKKLAILVGKGSMDYTYQRTTQYGKNESSSGRYIWAIIKENDLITIFFSKHHNKKAASNDADYYYFDLGYLKNFIENQNGGDKDLSGTAFNKLIGTLPKRTSGRKRNVPQFNLPKVNIDNKDWFFDIDNGKLIYSKNVNRSVDIEDAIDSLPEKEAEKILDAL